MNIPYIRSGDYYIPDLKLPEESCEPLLMWMALGKIVGSLFFFLGGYGIIASS